MTIFQHMKSVDPAAVETAERRHLLWQEYGQRLRDWAAKYEGAAMSAGPAIGPVAFVVMTFGEFRVEGLMSRWYPNKGRWRASVNGGFVPYRNSLAWREMEELKMTLPAAAGIPDAVRPARDPDGSHYLLTPLIFAVDGVAYAMFTNEPHPDGDAKASPSAVWEECARSEIEEALGRVKAQGMTVPFDTSKPPWSV